MGCLYQLIFPNGKSYIGITKKTAEQRFREHYRNSLKGISEYPNYSPSEKAIADQKYGLDNFGRLPWLTLLGRAIREYGEKSVIVRTLVITNDMEFLKELEIKAIKRYRTFNGNGYNTSKGNCPNEIDWVVNTKMWRITLKPRLDWPPKYFKNKAVYIADFDSLEEARRVYIEIYREEVRMWGKRCIAEG